MRRRLQDTLNVGNDTFPKPPVVYPHPIVPLSAGWLALFHNRGWLNAGLDPFYGGAAPRETGTPRKFGAPPRVIKEPQGLPQSILLRS